LRQQPHGPAFFPRPAPYSLNHNGVYR